MSDTQQMVATGGNNHVTLPTGLLDQALALDTPDAPAPVVAPQKELSTFEVALKNNQANVEKVETKVEDQTAPVKQESDPVLDLPDNAKVRVKLDGKEEVVTYKDYKDTLSREAVWTKRMQTLAEQRKQAEQEFVQKYAWLQQQALAVEAAKAALGQQRPLKEQLAELATQQQQPKPD
jgi:hypothetical protein